MRASAARWLGALAFAVSALSVPVVLGCSGTFDGTKVEGEPCTRTPECVGGLMCIAGVCRGADAGPRDSGLDPEDDAGVDAAVVDADVLDGDVLDADVLDADVLDAASGEDAGADDASPE